MWVPHTAPGLLRSSSRRKTPCRQPLFSLLCAPYLTCACLSISEARAGGTNAEAMKNTGLYHQTWKESEQSQPGFQALEERTLYFAEERGASEGLCPSPPGSVAMGRSCHHLGLFTCTNPMGHIAPPNPGVMHYPPQPASGP